MNLLDDLRNHEQSLGPLEINNLEVKCSFNLVGVKENMLARFEAISNWDKMKRAMALILRFKLKLM